MYKYISFLAYFLIFAALFPVFADLTGSKDLFFDGIPYPYSLYYEYRWSYLIGGLILGILAWFSARQRIDEVTDYKLYTRATFSKKQRELLKSGKKGERKLKHLAMRTGWAPILQPSLSKKGWQDMSGNKTAALRIKKNKDGELHLAPSKMRAMINIYIIIIGIVLLTVPLWADGGPGSLIWTNLFGILLIILGVLLFKLHIHFYFDKKRNEFIEVENSFLKKKTTGNKKLLALDDIKALQIVCTYKQESTSDFNRMEDGYEWELNIIKKDAKRHNVIICSRRVPLTESAITIAKFLNVPVWEDVGAHFGLVQEQTVTVPTLDSIFDKIRGRKA